MDTPIIEPRPAEPWRRAYPAGVDWDMAFPRETLPDVLASAVSRFGARPALEFLGRSWTYAELGGAVDRAAGALAALGVGLGSRVGLCLPNGPAFVIAYFAVLRAGGTVVTYSPLYVEEELAAQATASATTIMITVDLEPVLPRVLGLLRHGVVQRVIVCPFGEMLTPLKGLLFRVLKRKSIGAIPRQDNVTLWRDVLAATPLRVPPGIAPEDVAVLQFTGGTTGSPKAAMLTHANLCANLRQVRAWFTEGRDGEERMLAVIPFFHVFAMTAVLNAGLVMGAELVMLPRYDWKSLQAALRRRKPTVFHAVPTLFKAVLDAGATREELASLRHCISGGAPLPAQLRADFAALSGSSIGEGYGLTEASPVCFCNPSGHGNRDGTIGLPLPGTRFTIRSLEDGRALPPGERGELCVAGPQVMAGYLDRPEETARVLGDDGFLRTGDVGIADADGYVTLVDRIKDLIICGGFNVYPRNVEEAIYRHPDVAAATVVGMPDAYRGESVAAFVEPKAGATVTAEELLRFLRDKLSPIEMPRKLEVREKLPRTVVGKLSKKELRAELLGQTPG